MPVPHLTYVALAILSAAALVFELTLTRLLSVVLWYPFAFAAIGVAMLGFGTAAVWLTISPRLQAVDATNLLTGTAIAFGLCVALGYPLWNELPVAPMSLAHDPWQILWLALLLLLLSAPFFFAGLFIARLFAMAPVAGAKLYAADLGGAAAGVLLYALFLGPVGGPGMIAVSGGLALLSSLLIDPGPLPRRALIALSVAALWVGAPRIEALMPLRITPNKLLGNHPVRRPLAWNPGSAIDVVKAPNGAHILFDGGTAVSFAPTANHRPARPSPPVGLRAIAPRMAPLGSQLIIGSGGGVEVRAAIGAGYRRILAVEIDATVNTLMRGRLATLTGGIFSHPAVELYTAEARGFLAALPVHERFDTIVAFHTISNAASAAGGMSLAESYTLTVEALELMLRHLSDHGTLVLSRPEPQIGRLAATLAQAWALRGEARDLRQHVAIVSQGEARPAFITALVCSLQRITKQKMAALAEVGINRVIYAPGTGDSHDLFAAILGGERSTAERLARTQPFALAQLEPTTDDRPFFNLPQSWGSVGWSEIAAVLASGTSARFRLEDRPVAQVAVLLALTLLGLITAVAMAPVGRAVHRQIGVTSAIRFGIPFAALGWGYILTEVVLIQLLTRIVGQPGWSIVTVLATMLLSSGLGSAWLAGQRQLPPRRACLLAVSATVSVALLIPLLVDLVGSAPFAARALFAAAVVAPVGLCLGVPFAATLREVNSQPDSVQPLRPGSGQALVAWAWAMNSLSAVAGSMAALIVSSAFGFTATALLASISYGLAWALVGKSHTVVAKT